jgi:D-alanyl-D-alanine carboxypeptidase
LYYPAWLEFMTFFADLFMRRIHPMPPRPFFARRPVGLAFAGLLASALFLQPADAKPRRKQFFYAPPQAAMVVDGHTGKIIHATNPDEPRYPASITKVMTLYLLFEQLKDGKLKLDSPLRVSANAAAQAPSKLGLPPGSTISVKDVIYALVTKSANDCAVVVAENLAASEEEFARQMTLKARAMGMTNTTFRNASGLPNSEQRTTARDLITLGQHVLADFPDYAAVFRTRSFTYDGESHRNHNGLLFTYQGTEGLKTGFTQASGFNLLTSVRRDNRHLLAVVLGGRSAVERNARMRTLLNASWVQAAGGSKNKIAPPTTWAIASVSSRPSADAGGLEMPERNPAFHPTTSERELTLAMSTMLDLNTQRPKPATPVVASAGISPALAGASAAQSALAAGSSAAQPILAAGSAAQPVIAAEGGAAQVQAQAVVAAAAPSEAAVSDEDAIQADLAAAEEEATADDEASTEEGDTVANTAAPPQPASILGPYHIQVGSYASQSGAKTWLQAVAGKAKSVVNGHGELTVEGQVNGQARYRARFGQFSEAEARTACGKMKALSIDCMVVRAE